MDEGESWREGGASKHCFAVGHNGAVKHSPPLQGKDLPNRPTLSNGDGIFFTGAPYGSVSVVSALVLKGESAVIFFLDYMMSFFLLHIPNCLIHLRARMIFTGRLRMLE